MSNEDWLFDPMLSHKVANICSHRAIVVDWTMGRVAMVSQILTLMSDANMPNRDITYDGIYQRIQISG